MKVIQPWVKQGLQRLHIYVADAVGKEFRELCKKNRISLSKQTEALIKGFIAKSKKKSK